MRRIYKQALFFNAAPSANFSSTSPCGIESRGLTQPRKRKRIEAYLFESLFQAWQLALLDNEGLIVEIFDDVVMFVLINFEDDGLDGGIAFNQNACLFFSPHVLLSFREETRKQGGGGGATKFFSSLCGRGLNKRGKGEMNMDESVKVCRRDSNEMSFLPLIALGMISPAGYERGRNNGRTMIYAQDFVGK